MHLHPLIGAALALGLAAAPDCARAMRCELNGVAVNTDNGSSTAGKSGLLRCYRPDGALAREQELRDGQYLGLDKRYDEDGSVSERQVNANGNTQGRAREFYPGGKLKHEAVYENGSAVGLSKSFHRNGRVAALRFAERAQSQARVAIEYNEQGQLTELRCGAHSFIDEDRAPCGFEGKAVEVDLYTARGERRAHLNLREGKILAAQEFDREGKLAESFEATNEGRIERRFHPNGSRASEFVIAHDYRVAEPQWYMNGQVKSKLVREPVDRAPKTQVEYFRDTGVLETREQLRGDKRLRQEKFDEQGRLSEEFVYADDGPLQRHRKFATDGRVSVDEEFYPDGSRKTPSKTPDVAEGR